MKAPIFKIAQSLAIFCLLFFGTFVLFPYVATNTRYDKLDEVHPSFPIAIRRDDAPGIVRWAEYKKNPKAFAEKLMLAAPGDKFKMDESRFFTLDPGTGSSLVLFLREDDYDFWARYSVENGVVRPMAFRFTGAFVVFYCMLAGVLGTPVVVGLWRKFRPKNRTSSAAAAGKN